MIEPQAGNVALGIGRPERNVAAAAKQWHKVGLHLLVPIYLPALQCGRCRGCVGDNLPFDTLEVRDLAASGPIRCLLAWYIAVEFHPRGTAAGDKIFLHETERTG